MSVIAGTQLSRSQRPGFVGPFRLLVSPEPWKAFGFMVVSFLLGTAWLVLLTTLVAIGGMLWVYEARIERWRFQKQLGIALPERYRPFNPGSDWGRFRARLSDRQTWLDLVYSVLLFPIGVAELAIAAAFVLLPIELLISPVLYALGSPVEAPFQVSSGLNVASPAGNHLDTPVELIPAAIAGAVLVLALPYVLIGVVRAHTWLAWRLLGGSGSAQTEKAVAA